jgi:alpha-L-fucosidase
MKRRTLVKSLAAALPSLWFSRTLANSFIEQLYAGEAIAKGPFNPTWESLQNYKTPGWFRDAKLGMWAHWGPQCQPGAGDNFCK